MAWIYPPLQAKVEPREDDIMISVPAKSGTTWTMNIVYQLRTGGNPDFEDIYQELHWVEYKERPDQSDEELTERWKALPKDVRRGFKTHSGPASPFFTFRDTTQHIVVMRNPEEAIVSFRIFLENHNPALFDQWGISMEQRKEMFFRDDFPTWYKDVALNFRPPGAPEIPGGFATMFFWEFVKGWWPLRNKPNVLMLHFSEMKKDHKGSVEKIAKFLGYEPTAEQWPKILEYTSFPWMKENGIKFRAKTLGSDVPALLPHAMVRKGAVGDAKADGMTDEIAADMKEWAMKMVGDEAAVKYLYEGGPIPPG